MAMKLEDVGKVAMGIRLGCLAGGAFAWLVLGWSEVGLVILLAGLIFGLLMRIEAFRIWFVARLTGMPTSVIRDALTDGRVVQAGVQAAPPVTKTAEKLPADELDRLVKANRHEAVLLKRDWPAGAGATQNSWLGGCPNLPDGVDWPVHATTGFALHHLCQIDLSEMPALEGRNDLPREGMLWFFADIGEEMAWDHGPDTPHSAVVYHPVSTVGAPAVSPPDNLPFVAHPETQMGSRLESYGAPHERVYPRWPVSGHVGGVWDVDHKPEGVSYSSGYVDAMLAQQDRERAVIMGAATARATDGPWSPFEQNREKFMNANGDAATRTVRTYNPATPQGMFPFCGAFGQRMVATACDMIEAKTLQSKRYSFGSDAEKTARQAAYDDAKARFEGLASALSGVAGDAPLPAAAQTAFDDVMHEFATANLFGLSAHDVMRTALIGHVAASMDDPSLAGLVPDGFIKQVHDVVLPSHHYAQHTLFGVRNAGTNPTGGQGVRLAQFDSDYALGMMFCDVGIVDFWIDAGDLAAGRWERAWAGTAGG